MDDHVEKLVARCNDCTLMAMPMRAEPIKSTTLPEEPWEQVAVDFLGPLPTGEKLLLIVDYYSRYYEVVIMYKTNAERVIKALLDIFA